MDETTVKVLQRGLRDGIIAGAVIVTIGVVFSYWYRGL